MQAASFTSTQHLLQPSTPEAPAHTHITIHTKINNTTTATMKFNSQIILAFLTMGFAGICTAANSGSPGTQQQVVGAPPPAIPLESAQTPATADDDNTPCWSARDCNGTQCCAFDPTNITGAGVCAAQSANCVTKHIIFKKDHVVIIHDEI